MIFNIGGASSPDGAAQAGGEQAEAQASAPEEPKK